MRTVLWKDLEPDRWQKFRFAWLAKLLWPFCKLRGHDPFLLDGDCAYCWRCGYRLRALDPPKPHPYRAPQEPVEPKEICACADPDCPIFGRMLRARNRARERARRGRS